MAETIFDPGKAAEYYDDANVSDFYEQCWGGEDIHIGRYATGRETVAEASAAMTRHLLEVARIEPGCEVLDIACGFGGTLRMLARSGCRVSGIDISPNCVRRARAANEAAGLADRIDVAIGDFHDIDSAPASRDAVICQEAIIHSHDRPQVFAEVCRVLRPTGIFAFSDILTGDGADIDRVRTAFSRIGSRAGATVRDYRRMAESAGLEVFHVEERRRDIRTHYDKLAERLAQPDVELDAEAKASIAKNLAYWQAALADGDITWACFAARKP